MERNSDFLIENGVLVDYCGQGGDIRIPEGVTAIGRDVFEGNGRIRSVTLPEGVRRIEEGAFYSCQGLVLVTLAEGLETIAPRAFGECGIAAIRFPGSLKRIGECAFLGCYQLTALTIPENVTALADGAFASCHRLTSVTIPEKFKPSLSRIFGAHAEETCRFTLASVPASAVPPVAASSLPALCLRDGVLVGYCGGAADVAVPRGVTAIGEHALAGCDTVRSVTLPEGVSTVMWGAFWSCKQLTSVTLPEGLEEIEGYAFAECPHLTALTIPRSVREIGDGALAGCDALRTLTIPARFKDKLPAILDKDGQSELLNWQDQFKALQRLDMYNYAHDMTSAEIFTPSSRINKMGRALCRAIERAKSVPVFYHLEQKKAAK